MNDPPNRNKASELVVPTRIRNALQRDEDNHDRRPSFEAVDQKTGEQRSRRAAAATIVV